MALKPFVRVEGKGIRKNDLFGYWELEQGDTAMPVIVPRYSDKSSHMFGTWGGATVTLKQGNDPDLTAFENAYDTDLVDIINTEDAKVRPILANAYALKPEISGGDGTTSVRVAIVGHGEAK